MTVETSRTPPPLGSPAAQAGRGESQVAVEIQAPAAASRPVAEGAAPQQRWANARGDLAEARPARPNPDYAVPRDNAGCIRLTWSGLGGAFVGGLVGGLMGGPVGAAAGAASGGTLACCFVGCVNNGISC